MRHLIKSTRFATPFFVGIASIKKTLLFSAVCLSVIAVNVQANEADDAVAAEHLQKQIDSENQAAHDKAEKKWQEENAPHASGSDGFGGFICILIVPFFCYLFYRAVKKP